MRIGWSALKKFINNTNLYNFLNYIELDNDYYIWLSYQNENFSCMLPKGTEETKDFVDNFKSKAIIKDDIASDGQTYSKVTHVKSGRFLNALFVVFSTSEKTSNDTTGYVSIKLFDGDNETEDASQANKTVLDFEPPFDYEIYGGGIQSLKDMVNDFYVSAIILPHVPSNFGGSVYNIRNKLLIQPREDVFRGGFGAVELLYDNNLHTNCIRIIVNHDRGIKNKFQLELQYYK